MAHLLTAMKQKKMSDTIKYSKEVTDFIESGASRENEFYHFPCYFKKVGEGLFELCDFKETNGELKHIVEQMENPNPEEVVKFIRPVRFGDYGEEVMSNVDNKINEAVAGKIKGKSYFAQYSGYNFCGYVWWQAGQWHCEVWQYNSHIKTVSADTLEDIMIEVSDEFGYG